MLPDALVGASRSGAGVLLYSGEILEGDGVRGLMRSAVARVAGRYAGAILASSEATANAYRRRGIEATVHYPPIKPPEDPDSLPARGAELRERFGIGPEERIVCSLGAITEGRGQDTLVEALALSIADGHDWRLVIGGEPYDRPADLAFNEHLKTLADQLGVGDRIILAGRIEDPMVLYAASDIFVNPARVAESFGRAACEALLAGCPVISTRVGATAEALKDGETALLIPPDAPGALHKAITTLLRDPNQAAELANRGYQFVHDYFSVETGSANFIQAINSTRSDPVTATA